jgi:hypothetical protein
VNKKLIIAVVIILLLLLLGGIWLSRGLSQKTLPATEAGGTQPEGQVTGAVGQKQSLRTLMGLANSQSCDYADDKTGTSGKIYISAGRVRGDFATVVNGEATASHMYSDGQTMYIWMDGSAIGYKSSMVSTTPAPTGSQTSSNVDVDQQLDYKCQSWSADESMFRLPSGVDFKDLSSAMAVPSGTTLPNKATKCSACDSLSGDAKTQCLTALGC